MDLLFCLAMSCLSFAAADAAKREGVVVTGPTVPPGFTRATGKREGFFVILGALNLQDTFLVD